MKDEKKSAESVIDEIARDRGLTVDDLKNHSSAKKPDMWKRILCIFIILAIYGALVACIFLVHDYSLIFAILLIAFCFCVKPILAGLKKLFKIQDISKMG